MTRTLLIALLAILIFGVASAGQKDGNAQTAAASVRINLTNRAQGDWVAVGGCVSVGEIVVARQGIKSCQSTSPSSFKLGLQGGTSSAIDVTREDNYSIDVSDASGACRTLKGALETVNGLIPSIRQYYVYLWSVKPCAR
jgi:hypothetical protein